MNWITADGNGVVITVRVVPRASRNELAGIMGDAVKLRVCAPPVDGKANEGVVEFLAERLDVARSRIGIRSGATGRLKRVRIEGMTVDMARQRLGV